MALRIRASTYRGEAGFTVSGRPVGERYGRLTRVFVRTRIAAERIREMIRAGRQIDTAAFEEAHRV